MTRSLSKPGLQSLTIVLALYAVLLFLSLKATNARIFLGITLDLLITVPLVYYVLSRKHGATFWQVLPFVMLGFVLGEFMIPDAGKDLLHTFKRWMLPALEVVTLVLAVYKLRRAIPQAKGHSDFFDRIKIVVHELLPLKFLAHAVATEISVIYYSFFVWRYANESDMLFSYHRKNSNFILYIFFAAIVLLEAGVLHILLARWSDLLAWGFTVTSLYVVLQIVAQMKAMRCRFINITDFLQLRYGLFREVVIPFQFIERIDVGDKEVVDEGARVTMGMFKSLEEVNVTLVLRQDVAVVGFYGMKRNARVIRFFVDRKDEFVALLQERMQEQF